MVSGTLLWRRTYPAHCICLRQSRQWWDLFGSSFWRPSWIVGKRYLNYSLASVSKARTAGTAVGSAWSAEQVHQSQAESRSSPRGEGVSMQHGGNGRLFWTATRCLCEQWSFQNCVQCFHSVKICLVIRKGAAMSKNSFSRKGPVRPLVFLHVRAVHVRDGELHPGCYICWPDQWLIFKRNVSILAWQITSGKVF